MFTEKRVDGNSVSSISGDVVRGKYRYAGKGVVQVDSTFCTSKVVRPGMAYKSEEMGYDTLCVDTLFEGFKVFMTPKEVSDLVMGKIKEIAAAELPKMWAWMERHPEASTTILRISVTVDGHTGETVVYLYR